MKQGIWRYCVTSAAALALTCGSAFAQGIPLPAKQIPQFIDPLPLLSVAGGPFETIIAGAGEITLNMFEFKASMMPSTGWPGAATYTGTWVFGYRQGPLAAAPATAVGTYIGPFIVATRGTPTQVRYVNNLTSTNIFWREWTDQSLHSVFHQVYGFPMPTLFNANHYPGPVPAVPHLHGGEDPAVTDGGPEAWFLSNMGGLPGAPAVVNSQGAAYYTMPGAGALANEAVYRYPNSQEASPLWFHDHLLGATRLNATFAGLAGAYAIKDPGMTLPTGLDPIGLVNADGTNLRYSVPMVLQDRMFDTNGQLFFPIIGINPEHPYWIPEFVGDTNVVNGKVWPFMNVDQQRYRFYIINGSNSRPYELFLQDQASGIQGPPMWVIATDGGYLDTPILIDPNASGRQKKAGVQSTLTIMPGERYEIIVDFRDPVWRSRLPITATFPRNLILRNVGVTVLGAPNVNLDGRVMQFRVSATQPVDTSYNPRSGIAIRTGTQLIKRLVNTATGALAAGVTANKTRQLVLIEIMGMGGPLEVLLNNTKWNGLRPDMVTPVDGAALVQNNWLTEFPNEGDTEVWEIVNMTADRHPIHLHGVQFQILNRQAFNGTGYRKAYDAAFPGVTFNDPMTGLPVTFAPGVFIPGFGSPLTYAPSIASGGKYGGNPDVFPYLKGAPAPQLSYEVGWKDTAIMNPGEVTRIAVRFAPYAYDDTNPYFPYDPSAQNGYYVWHCHITDHEDNEMMRPDQFVPNPAAVRTYIQGAHF